MRLNRDRPALGLSSALAFAAVLLGIAGLLIAVTAPGPAPAGLRSNPRGPATNAHPAHTGSPPTSAPAGSANVTPKPIPAGKTFGLTHSMTGTVFATIPITAPTFPHPYTGSGPPGDLVNAQVVGQVIATTWRGFAASYVDDLHQRLWTYATATMKDVLAGSLLAPEIPWPPQFGRVSFSAPPQTAYPISFLAEIQGQSYTLTTANREVVFTQASAGAPWLVAFAVSYSGPPQFQAGNSVAVAPPSGALVTAPQEFAAYSQKLDTQNVKPTTVPPAFTFSPLLKLLFAGDQTRLAHERSQGISMVFTHKVGTKSLQFATAPVPDATHAGVLQCFVLKETADFRPAKGKSLVQTVTKFDNWSNLLPPGLYSAIQQTASFDVCLTQYTTAAKKGRITFDGLTGGNYAVTGTPA